MTLPIENLVSDLSVGPLAPGGSVTLPHGIRRANGTVHGQSVAPDQVLPNQDTPIVVSNITTTNVTFTNKSGSPASAIFRCLTFRSILPAAQITPLGWQGTSGQGTSNAFLSQSAWFIDPVGGNDKNDGLSPATAVKTYAEVVRRWGTNAPVLNPGPTGCTITFLNDQPDFSDPVVFRGIVLDGGGAFPNATLRIVGTLTSQATGTFSAVVVKNRATGTRWNVTDGSKPAAFWTPFVGHLVHDTTADAWFWIDADLGAKTAVATEPLAAGSVSTPQPPETPIAALDAYVVYKPTKVFVVDFSPQSQGGISPTLEHVWMVQPNGLGGFESTFIGTSVFVLESRTDGFLTATQSKDPITFTNNWIGSGVDILSGYFAGGSINVELIVQLSGLVVLDGDLAMNAAAVALQGNVILGAVFWTGGLDVPNVSSVGAGECVLAITAGAFYGTAALWGPAGAIAVHTGGEVQYSAPAVGAFLKPGGFTMDGVGTGSSYNPATGLWAGGLALTPANLDAAVPGGFGGSARGDLGSLIRKIV